MNRVRGVNVVLVLCFVGVVISVLGQTRNRPATNNDLKVKYRVVTNAGGQGQPSETTTMIKGARERSESHTGSGYDTINILQCDLKRIIQINDTVKKYIITPTESDASSASVATPTPTPAGPTRQGGIVTYTTSIVDTGERKEMFGFTARHVKSTTLIESSPDACNPVKQHIEVDGWYIDFNVAFDCQSNRPPSTYNRGTRSGCQDQTRFKREGTGKVGYPLVETMRMYGDDGQVMFSTTKEVIELSREPLDGSLFEIPAGYTQAASTQELYGIPSTSDVTSGNTAGQTAPKVNPTSGDTKPAALRVGVVQINNKTGKPVAADSLRARLLAQLADSGIDAVALNASSQMEAEPEAKAKNCDFILYTDLAALKSNKLGGMFGRVAGVGGSSKTEAKVEFKLFAVGESSPRLQSSTSAKGDDEESTAWTAMEAEARMVTGEVRKRGRN